MLPPNGDSKAADVFKEKLKPLDGAFQKNQNEMKKVRGEFFFHCGKTLISH